MAYNTENRNQFKALAEVLNIKLIERLRMEESGVYGVHASGKVNKYPHANYVFRILFGCAPENVEKLANSAIDEIRKIRENGALEVDIQKFLAEEKRTTETQLKENSFWQAYLSSQLELNEDPKMILTYLDSLKTISPENLKNFANTYLNGDNLIRFVLLPEKSSQSE
jgi:zinc protease